MSTIQIGDYSAWLCIEGTAAPVYGVDKDTKSASCWVASQEGKKFSVNWYNLTRRIPLQAIVLIDGQLCDTHIMLDARRFPDKPNGVGISYARTSDWTRRDFEFSRIIVTDQDDYLHTVDASYSIGTITLQLWRIDVEHVAPQTLKHQYGTPTLDHQVIHERSKKAGSHHVVYGEEYASEAPTVDMVRGRTLDSEPMVSFSFKYRPYGMLLANGIIPQPVIAQQSSPRESDVDEKTAAQIRRLENRLNALNPRPRLFPSSGMSKTLAAVAVASPGGTPPPASQCNTGPIQCCNSVQAANTPAVATLLGLLGVVVQDVTALVGVTCSPLSVIGVGGNSCSAQPVCCTNNSFNGVVAIGCTPININL
ncbi:hypothetical protein NMY22_g11165 [Coprinellus aureogranulatus]|nr:hypothetical protein NMY22_g11165 [Coprinellus aureogranulatus]